MTKITNSRIFKYIAWLIFVITLAKDSLTGYPLHTSFSLRYLDDLLLALLFIWMVTDLLRRKTAEPQVTFYLTLFCIFLGFHLLQALLLNNKSILYYPLFIRDNFWYFPVFYFSLRYLDASQLLRFLAFFTLTQIAFVSFQLLYHGAVHQSLLWEDDINGSLGANSSHILAYSLILSMAAIRNKAILFAALVVFILASARSAFLFAAIVFPASYLFSKFNIQRLTATLILASALVLPIVYHFSINTTATLDPITLLKQQQLELGENAGAARLSFLSYSVAKLQSLQDVLLGHGSASYASRSAVTLEGPKFIELQKEFRFHNEFISGGSSYNAWLVEHGVIVFSLLLLAFLYPVYSLRRNWAAAAAFAVIFMGVFVQKLMESYALGLVFWISYAYFLKLANVTNRSSALTSSASSKILFRFNSSNANGK